MKRKGAPDSPFPLLWLVRMEGSVVETMVLALCPPMVDIALPDGWWILCRNYATVVIEN